VGNFPQGQKQSEIQSGGQFWETVEEERVKGGLCRYFQGRKKEERFKGKQGGGFSHGTLMGGGEVESIMLSHLQHEWTETPTQAKVTKRIKGERKI